MEVKKEYLEWLTGHDHGTSSETLLSCLTGIPVSRMDIPYDPGDLGRCIRMLNLFPELRNRLGEVIKILPEWTPFIDCWKELEWKYADGLTWNNLSYEEQAKAKRKKHYFDIWKDLYEQMKQLECASRYLKGWRCQNSIGSWRNIPPDTF